MVGVIGVADGLPVSSGMGLGHRPRLSIRWTSDRTLCIEGVRPAAVAYALRGTPGVRDAIPTEHALHLVVDPLCGLTPEGLARRVSEVDESACPTPRTHEIAVCYEPPYAPDMAWVCRHSGLSEDAVIERHTSALYTVAFLGFAPGFGYLRGLAEPLRVPRLKTPRVRVPAGSVGLAGPYTGVYAREGPGGWRIIGRTARRLFEAGSSDPALLRVGDRVRFRAVSAGELPR
ncbi:MAG: allophanate hydrolase [Phycisphaerales bacterium]|nr:MAG: allophanate hydrolase [Phycisphaerales bacterium]